MLHSLRNNNGVDNSTAASSRAEAQGACACMIDFEGGQISNESRSVEYPNRNIIINFTPDCGHIAIKISLDPCLLLPFCPNTNRFRVRNNLRGDKLICNSKNGLIRIDEPEEPVLRCFRCAVLLHQPI